MNKDEAKFHGKLVKFIKYNLHLFPPTCKFETKIVRRNETSFAFNELSLKEERLLLKCKHRTHVQTHSDYGGLGTDCDGDIVSGGGLIFLQWYRRRNKEFFVIDIDDFIKERDNSDRKSLTEERANIIGKKLILGKLYDKHYQKI